VLDKSSKVTMLVNEQFANVQLPNDAALTTALSGEFTVNGDGTLGGDSKFTADLNTIKSDDPDRDDDVKDNYLETKKFPTAVFVPKEMRGLPKPLPTSGPIKGQLAGDLTVHGVTKPATFDVDGNLDGNTFVGKAKTEMKITDYGMKVPTLAILLRVEDRVRMTVDVVASAQQR
jgi:polyisoprenoid-binding protein YceI